MPEWKPGQRIAIDRRRIAVIDRTALKPIET